MGYLSVIFNKFNKKRDVKIIDEFRDRLWSSLPYQKLNRYYSYRICEDKVQDDVILKELEKYKYVEYKVLKSRYNLNDVMIEDLVRARLNTNYGKYFDKEIYLGKKYYYHLANYKNIYFKYINGECDSVIEELNKNAQLVEELKKESENKKLELSWKEYRDFINGCIPKIFDNYIPMDDLVEQGKWRPNEKLEWDEDNYILKYINKSLDGYIKKFIDEKKSNRYLNSKNKLVYCLKCGKSVIYKGKKPFKYCKQCGKEIKNNNDRIRIKTIRDNM